MNELITSLIGIVGGFALMLGALTKRTSANIWPKKALFFAGLSTLAWGGLIAVKTIYAATLTVNCLKLIEHYKTFGAGFSLGILLYSICVWRTESQKMEKKEGNITTAST